MQILSVIIAHPLRKVCGATNAGRELTVATADLLNADLVNVVSPQIELAIMWDANEALTIGRLPVRHFQSTSFLGPLASLMPRFFRVPLYNSQIPEYIRSGGFDLVHLHNLVPCFAAERVARMCQRINIPYVISTHGFNEVSRYARINGFGPVRTAMARMAIEKPFRRIVKGAEAFFALSDCERPLLAELGIDAERIRVVTNGVNEFYLEPPTAAEREAAREKFRIGSDPVLLFMGSLHSYKGTDVFLQSLRTIEGPFQAVLAGGFKDPSEPGAMLRTAGISGDLGRKVVFTGEVSNQELRALYNLADIFVYPTKGDTLPLVVLEAMACGLPVVSTKVGGVPFEVSPENGIVVPPEDVDAISAAVNQLLAAPQVRREMGMASRKRVQTVFRWSASARCAVEAYEDILKQIPLRKELSKDAKVLL